MAKPLFPLDGEMKWVGFPWLIITLKHQPYLPVYHNLITNKSDLFKHEVNIPVSKAGWLRREQPAWTSVPGVSASRPHSGVVSETLMSSRLVLLASKFPRVLGNEPGPVS